MLPTSLNAPQPLQVEGWAGGRLASQTSEFPENEGADFPEHLRRPSVDNPPTSYGEARTLSRTPSRMRASPTAFLAGKPKTLHAAP